MDDQNTGGVTREDALLIAAQQLCAVHRGNTTAVFELDRLVSEYNIDDFELERAQRDVKKLLEQQQREEAEEIKKRKTLTDISSYGWRDLLREIKNDLSGMSCRSPFSLAALEQQLLNIIDASGADVSLGLLNNLTPERLEDERLSGLRNKLEKIHPDEYAARVQDFLCQETFKDKERKNYAASRLMTFIEKESTAEKKRGQARQIMEKVCFGYEAENRFAGENRGMLPDFGDGENEFDKLHNTLWTMLPVDYMDKAQGIFIELGKGGFETYRRSCWYMAFIKKDSSRALAILGGTRFQDFTDGRVGWELGNTLKSMYPKEYADKEQAYLIKQGNRANSGYEQGQIASRLLDILRKEHDPKERNVRAYAIIRGIYFHQLQQSGFVELRDELEAMLPTTYTTRKRDWLIEQMGYDSLHRDTRRNASQLLALAKRDLRHALVILKGMKPKVLEESELAELSKELERKHPAAYERKILPYLVEQAENNWNISDHSVERLAAFIGNNRARASAVLKIIRPEFLGTERFLPVRYTFWVLQRKEYADKMQPALVHWTRSDVLRAHAAPLLLEIIKDCPDRAPAIVKGIRPQDLEREELSELRERLYQLKNAPPDVSSPARPTPAPNTLTATLAPRPGERK